jgi:hypothetical protein
MELLFLDIRHGKIITSNSICIYLYCILIFKFFYIFLGRTQWARALPQTNMARPTWTPWTRSTRNVLRPRSSARNLLEGARATRRAERRRTKASRQHLRPPPLSHHQQSRSSVGPCRSHHTSLRMTALCRNRRPRFRARQNHRMRQLVLKHFNRSCPSTTMRLSWLPARVGHLRLRCLHCAPNPARDPHPED